MSHDYLAEVEHRYRELELVRNLERRRLARARAEFHPGERPTSRHDAIEYQTLRRRIRALPSRLLGQLRARRVRHGFKNQS